MKSLSGLYNNKEVLYYSRVWLYIYSHSLLVLYVRKRLSSVENNFYVVFENVRYFSGHTNWEGIIETGSSTECINILRRSKTFNEFPDDYLKNLFFLSIIHQRDGGDTIQIVSSNVDFYNEKDIYTAIPWWHQIYPDIQ